MAMEYRSPQTWRGMPLVHVAIGARPAGGRRTIAHARGIIAVGDTAQGVIAVGLIAIGVVAVGPVAIGVVALGVAALGVVSVGVVTVGVVAAGVVALGLRVAGVVAAGALLRVAPDGRHSAYWPHRAVGVRRRPRRA